MKYSRTALGLLNAQYRSVLRKCMLINLGLFALGAVATATPANAEPITENVSNQTTQIHRFDADGGSYEITNSTYTDNQNVEVNGIATWLTGQSTGHGSNLEISSSTYTGNLSNIGGAIGVGTYGGKLTVINSTFENNHAVGDGGAIGTYAGMSISNSTFKGNTAKMTVESNYTEAAEAGSTPIGGGAISLGAISSTNIGSITGTTFENNVSGYNGGAIGTRLAKDANNSAAKLDIEATFTGNRAVKSGGAIYNTFYANNGLGKGDGVTVKGNFTGNSAGEFGGAIFNDGAEDKAGNGGVMTVGGTFTKNSAASQGGAVFNSGNIVIGENSRFSENSATNAGAIHSSGSLVIGDGTKFNNNTAENYAGAILFQNGTNMTVGNNVEFVNNKNGQAEGASDSGGAIAIDDQGNPNANFVASFGNGVKFQNNESSKSGGGLYMYESAGKLGFTVGENSSFEGNKAAVNGAAIAVYGSENGVSIGKNASFEANNAQKSGGAVYLSAFNGHNASMTIADGANFTGNKAGEQGGAAYNEGTLVFNGETTFTGNKALDESYAQGGAVYNAITEDGNANITFNGKTVFSGNESGFAGGALSADEGSVTFNDVAEFSNNTATNWGGAINWYSSNTDDDGEYIDALTFEKSATFTNNSAGDTSGGAIQNDGGKIVFKDGATFKGNKINESGMGGAIYNAAEMYIDGDTQFENNSANQGGAIHNVALADEETPNYGILLTGNSTFTGNTSEQGAAIYNGGTISLNNATFTNNIASGDSAAGGAIYNEESAVINFNGTATFSGNKDANGANDIYNAGTINLTAATDSTLNLALDGGINGSAGTINLNGNGIVDIDGAVKNQTVNVQSGTMLLDKAEADLFTLSSVNVQNNALIDTIDEVSNDYSSLVTLQDGAKIALDADLNDSASEGYKGFDKYSAESGATITISKLNLLSELSGSVSDRAFQIATAGNISIDNAVANSIKAYTSTAEYTLTGNTANDGTIKLSGGAAGTGGLDKAVDNTTTDADEQVIYEVTADETFHDSADTTIDRAEFVINGNNKTVTSDGADSIKIANTSNVEISDLKLASFTGAAIDNQGGDVVMDNVTFEDSNAMALKNSGSAKLTNSTVKAKILNTGTFDSDPNDYYSEFENAAGATANFDADRFHTGSGLANNGTANFTNSVQFVDSDLAITGTGTVNLVSGTTAFNNTASSNTINLASGANWSGVLASTGVVNTQNANIDTVTGSVTGGTLNIDANVAGKTIDTFGDASGAKIKSINLTNSQYGTDNTVSLSLSGASLDADYAITGGTNYFTEVTETGGNIVFGNKLVNASGMHDQIGSWAAGKNISASNTYDATTKSYATDGQTVAGALTALDTAIGDVNYADATVDPDSVLKTGAGAPTTVQGALDALDSGKQNKLTAGSGIDITSDTISIKSNSITHDMIKEAEVYKSNLSLGVQNEINQGVSADTRVGKQTTAYSGGALDGKTIGAGDTSTDITVVSALGTLNGAIASKTLTVDTTTGIATIKDGTTTANVYTKEAAEAIFTEKQKWVDNTLGIVSADADAVKEQYAGTNYLADATTLTGADKLLDAAIATKQDKLIAGQGIAIAADGKTVSVKLADTTTTKSGLQLSDDGLSVKVGNSLAISNEGYVGIKANSSQFEITSETGLNLADNAVTSSKIANGAVTFDKLASDAVATSITGATNKVATDAAVQSYVDGAIGNAITFNADNTVTLKVGSDSANVYDTTGTANYVKANAQSADYTATSGAVDLTSNSTIAQALQTLDAKKASLAQDNTFTGANTFKSDSGITIQNKTTPAISSNLVATQLNIGTDTHDVLQLTVSDSTNKGSALYVKDANVVTNRGFMALDENGKDRFSADKDGIELKKASGETTFSVESATGNTAVAGTMDIEGDTTIGDNFSVKATDGSFSAAGGKFTVDENGKITADSVTAANGFTVDTNNSLTSAGLNASAANIAGQAKVGSLKIGDTNYGISESGIIRGSEFHNANDSFFVTTGGAVTSTNVTANEYHNKDNSFFVTSGGALTASEYHNKDNSFFVTTGGAVTSTNVTANEFHNKDNSFFVTSGGALTASEYHNANNSFFVTTTGDITAHDVNATGNLNVTGTSNLKDTNVDGALNVTGESWLKNTHVDGALAVSEDASVGGNFAVAGTSYLHNTVVDGALATTGDASVGQNFAVTGTSYLHNTVVNGDMAVSGTTKTTALTFNGESYVAAMDQGDAAITNGTVDDQAKRTMATNATVAKTVGNLAALENTHGVTSVADVASAINSLATNVETATGGTFTNNVWKGTVTMAANPDYTYNGATGHANIMAFVNDLASNIGAETAAAKGNIANNKTVNANLDALDEAIGDRRNLGSANEAINQGTKTSVAAGMRAVGDAIGDMNFTGSHYVSAQNDLSGAVRSLDSNLYRVESDLRDLRRDFRRGMASMSAMSALVPNPRAHGNTSLAIGTGAYDGHTAAAIGGFHYLTDNIMLNAGVAWGNSSDAAYRMGVTFSW